MSDTTRSEFAALVAIDCGDREHVWKLRTAEGTEETGRLEQTPETVHAWIAGLVQRFAGRPVAVALEQRRGALLAMLLMYESLVLFPVHPTTVAQFRAAFFSSRAKDDPVDADLILTILERHRDRLRRLEPDTVDTRKILLLSEKRRQWVKEQTRWSNRLTTELKVYFPQVLVWFDDVTSPLVGALLRRWVKLEELRKADADELRHFFRAQNCRNNQRTEERIEQIRQALPAIQDEAIITGAVVEVRTAVKMLTALRESIEEIDGQIAALFATHPDRAIFASLPAAGAAMAPRLLAAMGSRRERFASAAEVQCFHGIAPVTVRSGRKCVVHFRHACPKFSRQTFHEWARLTIRYSDWARLFFDQQRRRGKGFHAAIRSLAFKWIRIIYACWQQRVPYDEARYLQALASRRTAKSTASAPANPAPTPTPSRPVNVQWKPCAGFFKPVGFSS